jgi:hypothetical protein
MGAILIEIIKPIVDKRPDLKPAQREGEQSGNPATRRLSSKKQVERDGSVMADLEREPERARNRREVAASPPEAVRGNDSGAWSLGVLRWGAEGLRP